jgi:hypothetical protein
MQKANCNRERPNYNPHPAYTRLMELSTQLRSSGDYPPAFIYGQLGRAGVVEWVSLVRTFRVMGDYMFFRHPHTDTRPDAVDRDLALSIVGDIEWLNVKSLAPKDMRCCICYSNYNEVVLDTDGSTVDDSPVKTPCCGQMIGRNCLVESLVSDCHCPMCRACCAATGLKFRLW